MFGNLDCEAISCSFCLNASFDCTISYPQTHIVRSFIVWVTLFILTKKHVKMFTSFQYTHNFLTIKKENVFFDKIKKENVSLLFLSLIEWESNVKRNSSFVTKYSFMLNGYSLEYY